ncbi:Autoinducer 2 sensor kinase/phosphatase LuxQ [Vibrio stylophorae]|uniref:Autoinducer 2 sensor kinase/phosphatase LuxQ n=1 Tax=Vibrio stylophorae TaxID=659351 RepID=A0ABN8DUY9_9VIBR|nr:LuxQ periplasmic sensor domain-containing protein [Vibrio stylophorae]CAH0535135.1 Autoinducer 2 sensor kinase/phosphatase LuxQ [Vibrio stylophorae]
MNQPREYSLAKYLSVLFVLCVGTVLVTLIFSNYFANKDNIARETARKLTQVDVQLDSELTHRLDTMSLAQQYQLQDSSLIQWLEQGELSQIENYFTQSDEQASLYTPDFRFIANSQKMLWQDSNSLFFGLEPAELMAIAKQQSNNQWQAHQSTSMLGHQHLLVRSRPIIDVQTGEMVAKGYIVLALEDNLSLASELQQKVNAEALALMVNGHIVTATAKPHSADLNGLMGKAIPHGRLRQVTPIELAGDYHDLAIVTLLDDTVTAALTAQLQRNLFIALVVLIGLSMLCAYIFKRAAVTPLSKLVDYANNTRHYHRAAAYTPSRISEFNRLGYAIEAAFSELFAKEQYQNSLFESAMSPIVVWRNHLELEHINKAGQQALGFVDQQQANPIFERFVLAAQPHLKKALSGQAVCGVVLHGMHDRAFLWNISPVIVNDAVVAVIAQGLDITALKDAQKQSERATQAAEQANHAKSHFLATMSHEIRTPLNGILGIAELLQEEASQQPPSSQQAQLNTLYASSRHLLSLVNDILDFSKIEQGELRIQIAPFSLPEQLDNICSVYQSLCAQKGLQFLTQIEALTQPIQGDALRLRQILHNLLSNAVKFTHQGTIELAVRTQREQLQLIVQDSGIGIEPHLIEHLFEPFTQGQNHSKREYQGTGLGLAIVQQLVQLMGGSIEVESQLRRGSRFIVTLPYLPVENGQIEKNSNANLPNSTPQSLKILLVEDNQVNAMVAQQFCQKMGHQVTWVENGKLALQAAEQQAFDLIIMDNHMPVMNGIEACQAIGQLLGEHTPAIIACTADVFQEAHQAFRDAGANAILTKPITKDELAKCIQTAMMCRRPIETTQPQLAHENGS